MKITVGVTLLLAGLAVADSSGANAAICADGHWRAGCIGRNGGFAVGPRGYAYDYRGHYGYRAWGNPYHRYGFGVHHPYGYGPRWRRW